MAVRTKIAITELIIYEQHTKLHVSGMFFALVLLYFIKYKIKNAL
jgi:hypothetical protein